MLVIDGKEQKSQRIDSEMGGCTSIPGLANQTQKRQYTHRDSARWQMHVIFLRKM